MGNIGAGEIVFILIFALIVFGPKRLPEIGRSVGKAMGELRRATNDLKAGFTEGFDDLGEPLILHGPTKTVKRWEPETKQSATEAPFPPDPAAPGGPKGEDGATPR